MIGKFGLHLLMIVKNAIKTVEGLLAEDGEGYVLKKKTKNPFPMNYQPKLDVSNELNQNCLLGIYSL
jgi:hypothetical protein